MITEITSNTINTMDTGELLLPRLITSVASQPSYSPDLAPTDQYFFFSINAKCFDQENFLLVFTLVFEE